MSYDSYIGLTFRKKFLSEVDGMHEGVVVRRRQIAPIGGGFLYTVM